MEIVYLMILAVVVVAGWPKSLWCIPAGLLMWGLSGGSSGGSSGLGNNAGYIMLPIVVLGVACWGVYSKARSASEADRD